MLSTRLNALLLSGIPQEDLWDVCCDHGLLGKEALNTGRFKKVFFVDRVPHIIDKLKTQIDGLEEAEIYLNSAEDLAAVLTGTVVIAGVGGHNVIKILGEWQRRGNLRAKRLVLNPHSHVGPLREFLLGFESYKIKETIVVRERERDREIIILERNPSDPEFPVLK